MTTALLRKLDVATENKILEAMTKALVKYPTPDMIRLRMPEQRTGRRLEKFPRA